VIALSGIGKAFGDRSLFAGVTLQLVAGARYGLVGANGSGKSTLVGMLAGDEPASDGTISMPNGVRIGMLRQDRTLDDAEPIVEVAMRGDGAAWSALAEQERLCETPGADPEAIADAEERVRAADGYTLAARAGRVLEGLGIPTAVHRQPLATLSGGFKLRVLLAQVLVGTPELLLLDEPNNHLDILTIVWLEEFLRSYPGVVVVISHDHRFLDNVATHVLDIDYDTITLYPGNYAAFVAQKVATRERMETEIARREQKIAEQRAFVERFRYKATKARQAQSRVKQIERIERELDDLQLARSSRRHPTFRFEQRRPSGKEVLVLEGLCKRYGERTVLCDVSLTVRRGERVAILGANGLGKSTLCKIVVDRLAPDTGSVRWGYETSVGYFPQNHGELLAEHDGTALDYLWEICPREGTSFVRGQLGQLLFTGEDVHKPVRALSGGEAARLIFSRIVVQKPNVLVLDEPTNHLDLEAIEALTTGLAAFEGTLLFVSHDRWFASALATRVVEVRADGIEDYPGGYEAYVAHRGVDHLDARRVLEQARRERGHAGVAPTTAGVGPVGAVAERAVGLDWQEVRERRRRHRKLLAERERVTGAIEQAEKRLAEIKALYCGDGFFDKTSRQDLAALESEQGALTVRIEARLGEWERLEAEIAALEATLPET
jgi:ATPase subunit of ABC transporter with duplicated ATPase domains